MMERYILREMTSIKIIDSKMENNGIFISYIVPCYNIKNYVLRCLESLNRQIINRDIEIEYILVNDGSSDGTLSVLKEFAIIDKRAIIVDQANQGVSAARNNGLKVAHGQYVFFLDGDDWLTDDASQIIYDVCQNEVPDIVVTNAYIVKEGEWDLKNEWNVCSGVDAGIYDTLEFARKVRSLPISFKAYRRDFLLEHDIFFCEDLRVGEVYTFFLNALTFSYKIAYTDKRIMNYLVRKNSVMRTVNLERDFTILNTIHRIDDFARKQMPELLDFSSYKLGLYGIVNEFGVFSYVNKSSYNLEVGQLLESIRHNSIYRNVQKYYMQNCFGLNRKTFYNILLYYFPVFITYRVLRLRKRIKGL